MYEFIQNAKRTRKLTLVCAGVLSACLLTSGAVAAKTRLATSEDLVSHPIYVLTTDPGALNLDPGYIDPAPGEYVVAVNGKMLVVSKAQLDTMISNGFFIQGTLLPNYSSCSSGDTSTSDGSGYGDRWIWEHEYLEHIRNGGILGFLTPEGKRVYFNYGDYAQHMIDNDWWPC